MGKGDETASTVHPPYVRHLLKFVAVAHVNAHGISGGGCVEAFHMEKNGCLSVARQGVSVSIWLPPDEKTAPYLSKSWA